ncbi:hypothetical protein PAL_GLEAN10019706 [Pteropus alecto]|uniref:Uncharacterized protein n=1 Tax=Pteropus alecto TaxID=9402 RepID=L5JSB0_PTEAL|nr:hypothetical protein PAL_GLEAN10019706 [Pteropus alecto]
MFGIPPKPWTQQKPDGRLAKKTLRFDQLPAVPPPRPPVSLHTVQPINGLHILKRHHATPAYLLGGPVELRVAVVFGFARSKNLEGKTLTSGQLAIVATRDEAKVPGQVSIPWKRFPVSEEFSPRQL